MCTVTFLPRSLDAFVLTSNRDEAPLRNTIPPEIYSEKNTNLLYPKDEVAGGTWIGVSSQKRLICLLNGGFTAHEREEQYRMSRGIIVKELLTSERADHTIKNFDFNGIEPFTIIMVNWKDSLELHELVWDGNLAHFTEKPLAPHIWSSSLLYTENVKKEREKWFSDFVFKNLSPSEAKILDFHKTAGSGNKENGIIMNRGFVKTKSITQFSKSHPSSMRYEDLQTNLITVVDF